MAPAPARAARRASSTVLIPQILTRNVLAIGLIPLRFVGRRQCHPQVRLQRGTSRSSPATRRPTSVCSRQGGGLQPSSRFGGAGVDVEGGGGVERGGWWEKERGRRE